MTVAELIEALQKIEDGTRLVCIDTLGYEGVYPMDNAVAQVELARPSDDEYSPIALIMPTTWR